DQFLWRRSELAARRRSPSLGCFLLAGLWCLLFFSLAGCKRTSYILPAMPPLALAVGCYVDAASSGVRRAFSRALWHGLPAVPRWGGWVRRPSDNVERLPASWLISGAATFILLLLAVHQLLPGYARKFSMRAQVRPNRVMSKDPN